MKIHSNYISAISLCSFSWLRPPFIYSIKMFFFHIWLYLVFIVVPAISIKMTLCTIRDSCIYICHLRMHDLHHLLLLYWLHNLYVVIEHLDVNVLLYLYLSAFLLIYIFGKRLSFSVLIYILMMHLIAYLAQLLS